MGIDLGNIYNWIEEFGASRYRLDEPSYNRMLELMSLTNKIARDGRSTMKSIWVNVPSDYEGGTWINIVFRGDCYAENDVWYNVQIDGCEVLNYDNKRGEGEITDATDMLDWLIETIKMVLDIVKKGEYEAYVSGVPYYKRNGVISRTDYYSIVPGAREKCASSLNENEIKELLNDEGTTDAYEEAMTARRFYEACAVVYRTLGIKKPEGPGFHGWEDDEAEKSRYGGLTPKEWYYVVADCRDDGLFKLPLDDEVYFVGWLRKKAPYFSYEYYGGHPWDIINKYSFSLRLCVVPELDSDKCKLMIVGDSADRSTDIIRAFLALRREGYAVELQGYEVLTNRLLERDYLSVVEEADPSHHGSTIAGHFARDEISLYKIKDKEILDKLIQATECEKLEEVKLA